MQLQPLFTQFIKPNLARLGGGVRSIHLFPEFLESSFRELSVLSLERFTNLFPTSFHQSHA